MLATQGGKAQAIEGVRDAHQSSLLLDAACCLLSGKAAGNLLAEEISDDLPGEGLNLLANNHGKGGHPFHLEGASDGIVIGHCNAVDANFKAASDNIL